MTTRRPLAELISEGLDLIVERARRAAVLAGVEDAYHARTRESWRRSSHEMYAVRGMDRPAAGSDRLDSRTSLLSVHVVNPTGSDYEVVRVRFRHLLNADGSPCDHRAIGREIIRNLTVVSDEEIHNLIGDPDEPREGD